MTSPEFGGETLPQKILGLHQVLTEHNVPFGFGGAIALAYHAEPRATDDIDINILLPPDQSKPVLSALDRLFVTPDRDEQLHRLTTQNQTRLLWDQTHVDLFFMDTAFHQSLAGRVGGVDFGGTEIPIISAEDLVVCKSLFNRPHDWTDIAKVVAIQGEHLDKGYVDRWLQFFVGASDPVLDHFRQIAAGS